MTPASLIRLERRAAPYGPTRPFTELVVEVNRIFHAFEARDYDEVHTEIRVQLPRLWDEMVGAIVAEDPRPSWRVLDFGAGTGFASGQVLRRLPPGALSALTCFDPSEEMLARCRAHVLPLASAARFCTHLDLAPGAVDLLLTNSVLHHLPDLEGSLARLESLVAPGGWWIAGHEPSSRFYKNPELARHLAAYRRENRWRRFLVPRKYLDRLRRAVVGDPLRAAAKRCLDEGLFARRPSADLIGRLVDVGVPHDDADIEAGLGLDPRDLEVRFAGRWRLAFLRSYSYMGDIWDQRLSSVWRARCAKLAQRFPEDGANFSVVWQRNA